MGNATFIDLIDVPLLKIACPERNNLQLEPWVRPIKASCTTYDIFSIRRVSAYLAQMAHESLFVPGQQENLNYSAQGLANTWPNRYAMDPKAKVKVPNARAKMLNRNPEAIGNDVYAGRMGNGAPSSGDGFLMRGTGPGQVTGRDNWTLFGKTVNMTAEQAVKYALTVEGGIMSFAWFWSKNGLNTLAETPGVEDETKKINGGYNGLEDRRTRFNNVVAEMIKRERSKKA